MPWYDDLQCQVEKCVSVEHAALMSELMVEIGVDEMIASNKRPRLLRHPAGNLFSRLRYRLFRK
ncbi:hypothetical protein [Mixta calida]|uniref:hypothetical protein n=1 Tax=Mixta calida TaxID=665913 RepID=UPI00403A846C